MTLLKARVGQRSVVGRRWEVSPRRVGLVVWALSVGAAAGAVVLVVAVRRSGDPLPEVYLGDVWSALVLPAVGLCLVNGSVYRRVGWLFGVGGLGSGLAAFGFAWAAWAERKPSLVGWAGAGVWIGSWVWQAGPLVAVLVLLLLPEGRATGWRRGASVAALAATGVQAMLSAFTGLTATDSISGATVAVPNPLAVAALERLVWPAFLLTFLVLLAVHVAGVVHLGLRWRVAEGRDRTCLAVLAMFAWPSLLPWGDVPAVGTWLDALVLPAFAVAVAVALLRFGGANADVVVGRTYLWASLTTCVVAAYLLVVTVLSALLQRAGGASVAVAASGVVALLVAPLRLRLQRSVDRTLYGARAHPYASVAGLSRRLQGSVSPDDVLPAVVRTITEELQLPYAAFRLAGDVGDLGDVSVVECGAPRGDLVRLPVNYLGTVVGELLVSTPGHGVALRAAERRLLAELARQSGAAAHGVATVAELRRSRERLVAAREEERRSLRRELHDDLGATLTGVALGIDAAGNQVPVGSAAAEQLEPGPQGGVDGGGGPAADHRRVAAAGPGRAGAGFRDPPPAACPQRGQRPGSAGGCGAVGDVAARGGGGRLPRRSRGGPQRRPARSRPARHGDAEDRSGLPRLGCRRRRARVRGDCRFGRRPIDDGATGG